MIVYWVSKHHFLRVSLRQLVVFLGHFQAHFDAAQRRDVFSPNRIELMKLLNAGDHVSPKKED